MPRGIPRNKATPAPTIIPEAPAASRNAINHPVIASHESDTRDQETGGVGERLMKSTGPAAKSLQASSLLANTDRPVDGEKLAMMAFMNEDITIRIASTSDKNAEQVFELNINGKLEFFRRGETKNVKRYFVDRLCRLKETVFTQREVLNNEGIKDIIQVPHTALKYDFSVIRDDNPRGKDWLQHVQAEIG